MKYKKIVAGFALLGIAIIVAWQLKPARTPEGLNLATQQDISDFNKAGAKADSSEWARRNANHGEANDVVSATRAFKEANDCLLYHSARHELTVLLNDKRTQDLSKETLETIQNMDSTSGKYLSILRQTEPLCAGTVQEKLAAAEEDAILKAALLGNPDAQSCFVTSNLSPLETTPPDHTKVLEKRYLEYAPRFTQSALERSDPYVASVALYRYVRTPTGHADYVDDLPKADPLLTWRAARLASLRALPERRTSLERDLEMLAKMKVLKPEEIEAADAWAKTTYRQEFAGTPAIDPLASSLCFSSATLTP